MRIKIRISTNAVVGVLPSLRSSTKTKIRLILGCRTYPKKARLRAWISNRIKFLIRLNDCQTFEPDEYVQHVSHGLSVRWIF